MTHSYSLNLSDEVLKGMTEKALRGELQTPAPLGYVMKSGRLSADSEEAEIVKRIFKLYTCGNMSSKDIACYLNSHLKSTKRGNRFERRTVEYILSNPVYTGKTRWNPNRRTKGTGHSKNGVIIAEGRHEAIVDDATYNLALKKLSEQRVRKRKQNNTHPLSGILKCKRCGGNMYLCGNIFRCGNYLNKKCLYPQGVSVRKIEKLLSESAYGEKSMFNPSVHPGYIYYDKESNSLDTVNNENQR